MGPKLQQRGAEITYGSDPDGLVWGYPCEPGRPAVLVGLLVSATATLAYFLLRLRRQRE
jgi:hypothetical protein